MYSSRFGPNQYVLSSVTEPAKERVAYFYPLYRRNDPPITLFYLLGIARQVGPRDGTTDILLLSYSKDGDTAIRAHARELAII